MPYGNQAGKSQDSHLISKLKRQMVEIMALIEGTSMANIYERAVMLAWKQFVAELKEANVNLPAVLEERHKVMPRWLRW